MAGACFTVYNVHSKLDTKKRVEKTLVNELHIPIAYIQYAEVDNQAIVDRLSKECNIPSEKIEWPLIYCDGEPIGDLDSVRRWSQQNSWLFKTNNVLSSSDSFLFQSFPSVLPTADPIILDTTSNESSWSPHSSMDSVNSEYLRSDILSLILDKETPQSTKNSKKLNLEPIIDPQAHNSPEMEVGVFSRVMNYFSWNTWVPPETKHIDLPDQSLTLAIPVLRQNWLFTWNQRSLLMYETEFIRCSADVSEIKKSRTYASVQSIKKYDENNFVIIYRNNETELYYTPRASEALQVFLDRLCSVS